MINSQCLGSLHSGPDKISHSHKIILKSSEHIFNKYALMCWKQESWQILNFFPLKLLREQYLHIPSFPKISFSKSSQGKHNSEHLDHKWLLKMSFIPTKIFSTSNYSGFKTWNDFTNWHSNIKAELEKRKSYRYDSSYFKPLHRDWKIWIIFIRQAISRTIICRWPNNNTNSCISRKPVIIKNPILLVICKIIYMYST